MANRSVNLADNVLAPALCCRGFQELGTVSAAYRELEISCVLCPVDTTWSREKSHFLSSPQTRTQSISWTSGILASNSQAKKNGSRISIAPPLCLLRRRSAGPKWCAIAI